MTKEKCPKCAGEIIGVEYAYGDKYRYDGISEYACVNYLNKDGCDYRIGRWCEEELEVGMVEPVFCKGGGHPRVFTIEQPKEEDINNPIEEDSHEHRGQGEASEREL